MKVNKDLNKLCGLLLAKAIKDLYPDAVLGDIQVGDEIANEAGFNYSFNCSERVNAQSFNKIIKQMKKNIDHAYEIKYVSVPKSEALEIFKDNKFKTELIQDDSKDLIDLVYFGNDYVDICEQLSIIKLSAIKIIQLSNVGGVYWKHNAKNEQLQSITGVAFENDDEAKSYNADVQDRIERDHRNINNNLELFAFDELAGQGLPFWLPKGANIKWEIDKYIHELLMRNRYMYVQTPVLGAKALYETSGHWSHYRANMFSPLQIDEDIEVLRPMTCPHHMLVYKMKPRSYRELPFSVFEDAILHRYESSGSLTGLERVRQMRLIDTHVICTNDQIKDVVARCYKIINEASNTFGIKIHSVDLSLHDKNDKEKFFEGEDLWKTAEDGLRNVLHSLNIEYHEAIGEAAFYGPKLDIQVKTALGRIITAYTIQLDFLLPQRFELEYKDANGQIVRPVLVHASVIGTIERFVSILLEQNKGVFPLWLSPVQISIITVDSNSHHEYANNLYSKLLSENIRVEYNQSDDRLSKKIRDAQIQKIPYQLVIGDNEIKENKVSYRKYGSQESVVVDLNEFINLINNEIKSKK